MPSHQASTASRDMFDTAPCGYIAIDTKALINIANATISNWLAISNAEIEGSPVTSLFSLASRVVFETSVLPSLHLQGEISGVSLDLKSRDGTNIPVLISASTHGTGTDRITQMVFLKADARRNFERDLLAARAEAEARLLMAQQQGELREQFVAVLGHDLRNPLAAFAAGIRMLSNNPADTRKAELLHLMQGSVQRMSRLIDNVLDFARNRLGGGIELDLDGGELEPAIRQAVDELRAVHPDRDVTVDLTILHDVACDAQRIGQLVSNLFGNALIHGDPAHPISVAATTSVDGGLDISVCNSGPPIAVSARAKLFDPFDRGGEDGYRKGLGLGLHIASEIAKAHGGVLDVQSDDITCFTFRMPPPD